MHAYNLELHICSIYYIANFIIDWFNKDARAEDPRFEMMDNGGEYESVIGFSNLGPRMFALSLQPTHPNPHNGGASAASDLTTYPLLF